MARSRLHKSFADYVAIAISPALIMVLIGSLVFFLQELGYSGEYSGRLKWILFWFVFAAVLIARISIEEGDQHAAVYVVAFWGAMALVLFRFLETGTVRIVGFVLLGLTWWCAKKLTWDCTLIDDSQDASGQGLLQITGFDTEENGASTEQDGQPKSQETSSQPNEKDETGTGNAKKSEEEKPHAPGVWVVYFSLAALPLFGLGQVFLPADDAARRASAFRYLWVYVAAGLGLLLTTSFLGLRRYLRQRKLAMPASMTRGWIGMGAFLAVGILFVCLILPRPNAAYSFTKVVDTVSEKVGKASDYALGSDDAGEGEGRRAGREAKEDESKQNGEGEKGNDGKKAGQTSKSDQPASGGKGKKEGQSESQGGKQSQKGETGDSSDKGEKDNEDKKKKDPSGGAGEPETQNKNGNSKEESSSQQPGSVGGTIAKIVKWLIYIAVGVAVVIYAMRHWETILAGLSRFWQDLMDLFAGLFGRKAADKTKADAAAENLPPDRPVRPFADYPNPFETGMEQDMGTNELIEYTYDALRAWGAEQGVPKSPDQTPTEYVQELSFRAPELSQDARRVAELYLQAAFSTTPPSSKSRAILRKAWNSLENMPRPVS